MDVISERIFLIRKKKEKAYGSSLYLECFYYKMIRQNIKKINLVLHTLF